MGPQARSNPSEVCDLPSIPITDLLFMLAQREQPNTDFPDKSFIPGMRDENPPTLNELSGWMDSESPNLHGITMNDSIGLIRHFPCVSEPFVR
jgi:hypothetical protein